MPELGPLGCGCPTAKLQLQHVVDKKKTCLSALTAPNSAISKRDLEP